MKNEPFSFKDVQTEIKALVEDSVAREGDKLTKKLKGELSAEVNQKVESITPKPNYFVRVATGLTLVMALGGLFVNDCFTRKNVNKLRDTQDGYARELSETNIRVESNTQKVEQLDNNTGELKREFESEEVRLNDRVASVTQQVNSLEEKFDRFRTTFVRETVNPLIDELRAYRSQISELREGLSALRAETPQGLRETLTRLNGVVALYSGALEEMKQDYSQRGTQISELQEITNRLREDLDNTKPDLDAQTSQQINDLESAIVVLNNNVGSLESDLSSSTQSLRSQLSDLKGRFDSDKTGMDSEINALKQSLGYQLANSGIQRYLTQHGRIEFSPSDNPLEAVYTFFRSNTLNDEVAMAIRLSGSVENFVETYLLPEIRFRKDWRTSYVGRRFWIYPQKPQTSKSNSNQQH